MAVIGKYGLVHCGGLRVCMALRVRHIAVLLGRWATGMHLVLVQCDIRLADDARGVLHSFGSHPGWHSNGRREASEWCDIRLARLGLQIMSRSPPMSRLCYDTRGQHFFLFIFVCGIL